MRRNAGTTAGLLALAALAVHTINPGGEGRGGSSGGGAGDGSKKSDSNEDKSDNAREGPWLATRAFFGAAQGADVPAKEDKLKPAIKALTSPVLSGSQRTTLRTLFGIDSTVCEAGNTSSLVATVADPAHTRMALFFDGQIDAIEQAAKEDGWVFARQWLPWLDAFDGSEHDIGVRRQQRRLEREQESLPGILVFRENDAARARPRSCLFVMLVAETPTGGVSEDALAAALNIANLLSDTTKIGLLAPSFSGSFPSLSRAILRWKKEKENKERLYETAYGGSVSSRRAAYAFFKTTNLGFFSGVQSDLDFDEAFRKLRENYGIAPESSAYLVEGESGYGADAADAVHRQDTKEQPAAVYEFPRDISHLRNAYQRATAVSSGQYQNPVPSIQLSLNDPSRGEDSIPVFSDADTPVAQSAALGTITEDLKRRGIRIAYIAATNSLDELFLAQFLRQQCPDVRVVIAGDADLLFLPAASQRALTGTLFLSTYPLFFEGDQALSSNLWASRYSLLSGNLQGLFNVTQILLWRLRGGTVTSAPKSLRGYAEIKGEPEARVDPYPGLWLLELTRFGFSPVDWVKAADPSGWLAPNPDANADQIPGELKEPLASSGWRITSQLSAIAIIAGYILFMFVYLIRTNRISWPVRVASGAGTASRFPLFVNGSLFISSIPWILGFPAAYDWDKAPDERLTVLCLGLAFVTPLLCLSWIAIKRVPASPESSNFLTDPLVPLSFLVYVFVVVTWLHSCSGADPGHAMFRWRSLHLYSSSSPALPFLTICIVFILGLLSEFYRRADTGETSPQLMLDSVKDIPAVKAYYRDLTQLIAGTARWTRLVTCGLATGISFLLLRNQLEAFEFAAYNWALCLAISVLVWALAGLCHDAAFIWFDLDRLLTLMESIPLKGVFARVARNWPKRQVWAFWKSTPHRALGVQMSEALHNGTLGGTEKQRDKAIEFLTLTRDRFAGDSQPDTAAYLHRLAYEKKAACIAEDLFVTQLWPAWKESPVDDGLEPQGEGEKTDEHRFSADFVALQCCNYLIYAVRQIQRVVWTISFLLVLLIMVLNSYAPQGPLSIGRYVAVLFVTAGCVVVYVFTGMERNWILSQISRTRPGELNTEFWLHIAALGFLPLLAVVVHLFPDLATFLYSWVAPGMESVK